MKCQILFSGKNKKNNIILSSAENAQRVVKVKWASPYQTIQVCNLVYLYNYLTDVIHKRKICIQVV